MKMFQGKNTRRFWPAVSSALVLLMLSITAHASDVRQLWQSRDQFVALERQDNSTKAPGQPNDHPVELTQERITAILSSIEMRQTDSSKPEALLTRPAIQALAPYLQQGLQQASPADDVTFAIIGLHDALYGLAKSPKVTTGRVFYKAGRLNIIVGIVQQEVRDRDDRRLFPFTPGSRKEAAEGEWSLLPRSGQNGYALIRKDWMTFGEDWQAPVIQPAVAEQRLQPVQPEKRSSDTRKPAERLSTLKELKDNGLISEEEYRGKRMEILNGL